MLMLGIQLVADALYNMWLAVFRPPEQTVVDGGPSIADARPSYATSSGKPCVVEPLALRVVYELQVEEARESPDAVRRAAERRINFYGELVGPRFKPTQGATGPTPRPCGNNGPIHGHSRSM